MSDREKTVWDEVDENNLQSNAGQTSAAKDDAAADDVDPGYVEAEAVEVKRKPGFKVIYVIALIGMLGLGFAGYIGYSLYSKLFGAEGAVDTMASGASLVDTSEALPASVQASQVQQTLPVGSGTSPTDVPAHPDDTMVPLDTMPSAAEPAVPVLPAPVSSGPVAAVCPQVSASPVCPAVVEKSSTRPVVVKRAAPRREAKVYKQKPKAVTTAQAPVAPAVLDEGTMGRLTGYKVLAIEPKVGEHQQAWIRGRDGKLYIVREGESFQGARVTSVLHADGAVKTTAGEILK